MGRFQAGRAWPFHGRRSRGRGKAKRPYRITPLALEARFRGLAKWRRPRTADQSRYIYSEIIRAAGEESYRSMARRLGVAHSYCRKVARRYYGASIQRARGEGGRVPPRRVVQPDIAKALAIDGDLVAGPIRKAPAPWWITREWASRDEIWASILLTQEQKAQAVAEFERRECARRGI